MRQNNFTLSSTEAELNALCEIVKELKPVTRLARELEIDDLPTAVLVDNKSATSIAINGIARHRLNI